MEVLYWIWNVSLAMAKKNKTKTQRKLMTMKIAATHSIYQKEEFSMSTMTELPMTRTFASAIFSNWYFNNKRQKKMFE